VSVWNSILQATHSALIDELNERFPDEKLELGLPKRFEGFRPLSPDSRILFHSIRSEDEGTGFAAISGRPDQSEKELSAIFSGTRDRGEKEFSLRGIRASFGEALPDAPKSRMTIWLPISIPSTGKGASTFDLALGLGV
jgi:hypothetical protein